MTRTQWTYVSLVWCDTLRGLRPTGCENLFWCFCFLVKTKIIKIFLVRAFFQQPSQYIVRSRLADIIGEAMDSTLSLLLFSNSQLTDLGNISITEYSLLCSDLTWITPWLSNIHFKNIQQAGINNIQRISNILNI